MANNDAKKALSQARKNANYYKKLSKELLKRAQLDVREYKHQLSQLKKQGIVAKYIDARTHKPTRYMLSKIKKFKDVATGHAMAIPSSKIPKEKIEKYVAKGTATERGKYLIVPKTAAKQRVSVVKGHLATYTPLGFGEERIIYLPYEAKNLNDIVRQLGDHESEINQLKEGNEQFGFQLFGHNAKRGFPDSESLYDYLTKNYSHLLTSPSQSQKAFSEFVLMRFKHRKGYPELEPYHGVKYYGKKNRRASDPYYENIVRQREAQRKREQRARESFEKKKLRLAKQKIYDRAKSNERMERRLAKRLLGE